MFKTTVLYNILKANRCTVASIMGTKAVDFEVFGHVQGVYFRKHTKELADQLGIKGWCMNTTQGTVLGHLQGPSDKIGEMMQWLKTKGSPSSVIEKTEFTNHKEILVYTFTDFAIRK